MNKQAGLIIFLVAVIILTVITGTAYAQNFEVNRFLVCEDVQDREPVGVSDSFDTSLGRVYIFLDAKDVSTPTKVDVVWLYEATEMRRTSLQLGQSRRWRTYAYKNLYDMKGQWRVELQDVSGNVLSSTTFTVK